MQATGGQTQTPDSKPEEGVSTFYCFKAQINSPFFGYYRTGSLI